MSDMNWISIYPQVLLLVMACVIAVVDLFIKHPQRTPTYLLTQLSLAVVGGVLTAAYLLRLLGAPVGRWAHVAVFPLLLALGAGKCAEVLAANGQGLPSEVAWATLYKGDGPWGSLVPEMPSHPAQLYEGLLVLLLLQLMAILAARGAFRSVDGTALFAGLVEQVGIHCPPRLVLGQQRGAGECFRDVLQHEERAGDNEAVMDQHRSFALEM